MSGIDSNVNCDSIWDVWSCSTIFAITIQFILKEKSVRIL